MSKRKSWITRSHSQSSILDLISSSTNVLEEDKTSALDARIKALEERVNSFETFYKVSTQRISHAENQLQIQKNKADELLSDIKNCTTEIENKIATANGATRDLIRDRIKLYVQMNSTYILSCLVNRNKRLLMLEETIPEVCTDMGKQFYWMKNVLKKGKPINREKMLNTLHKIIVLQNEEIKMAQQVFGNSA